MPPKIIWKEYDPDTEESKGPFLTWDGADVCYVETPRELSEHCGVHWVTHIALLED